MNRLAEEGFVVLGGPLDETRAMLIIDAPNPDEVKRRLSPDPWHEAQILSTTSIQPWQILLDRSAEVQPR